MEKNGEQLMEKNIAKAHKFGIIKDNYGNCISKVH